MSQKKRILILNIFLALALLLIYASGLFIDVTRDAAKYAYISKEIIQTNNWINLQILGEPYNQKPQLMFWLSAISFKIFGVSNFTFKLPQLLYSILGLFFTFKLGESIYNKRTGKTAASIVAFSIIFILYVQDIHTDTILFTNSAFSLWMLFKHLKTNKTKYLILGGLGLGLCILTKGPFGLMVPFLTVICYLIYHRNWKEFFKLKWFLLIGLAFLTAMPVFIQLYTNWGVKGLTFFFLENTVGRFTGTYLGHTPDPTFYIHNLAYLMLPWSFAFFMSIFYKTKAGIQNKLFKEEHFLIWGLLLFLILISVSKSKLPNYIMSALPLIAVLSGNFWIKNILQSKKLLKIQQILNYIIWCLAIVLIFLIAKEGMLWKTVLIILIFVASLIFTKPLRNTERTYYQSLLSISIIGLVLNFVALPVLFGFQAQPQAAEIINNSNSTNKKVYNYQVNQIKHLSRLNTDTTLQFNQTPEEKHFSYNYELMFYCKSPVVQIENEKELQIAMNTENAWIFCDEEGKNSILNRTSKVDTTYSFNHFSLKRTAKYLFPEEGKSPFTQRHLIRIPG